MPLYNSISNLHVSNETNGDILYFNNNWIKLSSGTNGSFLQTQNSLPQWNNKAYGNVSGTTSSPTTTSSTYVVIPEMTTTITTFGGKIILLFNGVFNIQHNDNFTIGIHQDSNLIAGTERQISFFGGSLLGLTPSNIVAIPINILGTVNSVSGSHTYDIRWKQTAGSARAINTMRQFTVIEI